MKTYKFLVIFLTLALFSGKTYSQDILDAYMIKLDGDSVTGSIKLPGGKIMGRNVVARLGDGIDFREKDSKGEFVFYKPKELKGFGYYYKGETIPVRYVTETVFKDKRLVILQIDGALRLYKDVWLDKIDLHTVNIEDYHIRKPDGELFFVTRKHFFKGKKRGLLKEYLSDCPVLADKFGEDYLDLDGLVKKYNEWYSGEKK